MRAVARAVSDEVVGGQAELFAQLDTIDGLRAWSDALVTLQRTRHAKGGCPIGSLAGQLAEQDEGARLELADGLDRWEAAIREGLERMAARGELRPGADPDALAQSTLAAVQGGLLLTQIRRDPNQLRSALDGAIDAIVAARALPDPLSAACGCAAARRRPQSRATPNSEHPARARKAEPMSGASRSRWAAVSDLLSAARGAHDAIKSRHHRGCRQCRRDDRKRSQLQVSNSRGAAERCCSSSRASVSRPPRSAPASGAAQVSPERRCVSRAPPAPTWPAP